MLLTRIFSKFLPFLFIRRDLSPRSRDLVALPEIAQARAARQFLPVVALVAVSQIGRLTIRPQLYRLASGPLIITTANPRISAYRPRPMPTCVNRQVQPSFEWAPKSPAPSPVLAQPRRLPYGVPAVLSDEWSYGRPSTPPLPSPVPTNAVPISSALLSFLWILAVALNLSTAMVMFPIRLLVRARPQRVNWMFVLGVSAIGMVARFKVANDVNPHIAVLSAWIVGFTSGEMKEVVLGQLHALWGSRRTAPSTVAESYMLAHPLLVFDARDGPIPVVAAIIDACKIKLGDKITTSTDDGGIIDTAMTAEVIAMLAAAAVKARETTDGRTSPQQVTPPVFRPVYGPLSPFGKGRRGSSCQLIASSPTPSPAPAPSRGSLVCATHTPARRPFTPSRRPHASRVDLSIHGVFSPFFPPHGHPATASSDAPTPPSLAPHPSLDTLTMDAPPDSRIPSASAGPSSSALDPKARSSTSASLLHTTRRLIKGWIVVSWLLAGSFGVKWVKEGT